MHLIVLTLFDLIFLHLERKLIALKVIKRKMAYMSEVDKHSTSRMCAYTHTYANTCSSNLINFNLLINEVNLCAVLFITKPQSETTL